MIAINLLKKFSFFKDFSSDQLKKMASLATEESHLAGEHMYKAGDAARSLFLVKEGKVVMFMENNMGPGKPPMPVTVDIITKGESMGWSAVVEPYIYTLGAHCIDNTVFITFDAIKLRKLMEKDAALGLKIMQATAKVISTRLTHTRIILIGERGLSTLTEY
jgi:Cyclic nucleotide-binding domain.